MYLFSDKVEHKIKDNCARVMVKHYADSDNIEIAESHKLITPVINKQTKIHDLFGPNSWLILRLFGITDNTFLTKKESVMVS